ncbi:MAG: hypothetical protein K2L34_10680, partial [Muribaculaceae bacterium]|nr:hypothetical protein [Muribaculaceae bacterium]
MILHQILAIVMLSLTVVFQPGSPSNEEPEDSLKGRITILLDSLKDQSEESAESTFEKFLAEGNPDRQDWT